VLGKDCNDTIGRCVSCFEHNGKGGTGYGEIEPIRVLLEVDAKDIDDAYEPYEFEADERYEFDHEIGRWKLLPPPEEQEAA
jgi:hypothetical protein